MENVQQASFPRLNEAAPNFNVKTTHGDRTLADYKGKWLILFSHPADFTPVCTTEFIGFAKAVPPPKTAAAADKRLTEGYDTTDWYYSTKSL